MRGIVIRRIRSGGASGNYFSKHNCRHNRISQQRRRKFKLYDLALEILMLMNYAYVLAARRRVVPMARGKVLFIRTTFCPIKQRYVLHLTATPVNPHHETGTGKQHQEGEGNRQYGT